MQLLGRRLQSLQQPMLTPLGRQGRNTKRKSRVKDRAVELWMKTARQTEAFKEKVAAKRTEQKWRYRDLNIVKHCVESEEFKTQEPAFIAQEPSKS